MALEVRTWEMRKNEKIKSAGPKSADLDVCMYSAGHERNAKKTPRKHYRTNAYLRKKKGFKKSSVPIFVTLGAQMGNP